jgi:hypothetical protein
MDVIQITGSITEGHPQAFRGDSYRGRENSYTQGSTMELNGVDFGLGPARAWVASERSCVRARGLGDKRSDVN